MADRDVSTIKDQIYYQYAKIITCASFGYQDWTEAKKNAYWFIKNKFKELKSWKISWSDIVREDWQLVESEKKCAYCWSKDNLHKEHIVRKSLSIKPECTTCEKIQWIHNQIWACQRCNSSKWTLGLYSFYKKILPENPKFYDKVDNLAEKKYLKTIYDCHICAGTLENNVWEVPVLDIDSIV